MLYMYLQTNIAIYRTVHFIRKNRENAFKIGREFCSIFYIIYKEFKKNSLYPSENIWDSLTGTRGFEDMSVARFVSKHTDFVKFFSKCNFKILQLKPALLSSFFRGYYVNDINLFSTNITEDTDRKFIVLYDNHYHYLLFLYNYLSGKGVDIQLNDSDDPYSVNEYSDSSCYKLIFEKKSHDFIDPIKNLLNFLYVGVEDRHDCFGNDDECLFNRYMMYCQS